MPKSVTVLCADRSPRRLASLSRALNEAGYSVLLADSAAHSIALCAEYKPDAAVLDEDLLCVDQWSVAEQLHLVSPRTRILVTAEDVESLKPLPAFVHATTPREDPAQAVSTMRELLRKK